MSRSNSSPEPVSDRHSRRSRYQEILEFSLHERTDGSARKEKNKDLLDEKHALEYRAGEPDLVTKRNDNSERVTVLPIRVLAQEKHALEYQAGEPDLVTKRNDNSERVTVLPIRVLSQKATETCISPIPLCTVITKRHFGEDDKEIPATLSFKKPIGRRSPVSHQNTVKSHEIEKSDLTFKPSLSDFDPSSQ